MLLLYVFVFLFGLITGSFLNVCIYRIPMNESLIFPPSHCMRCGGKIAWYDLFPVVSFIILNGRCRKCGGKIPLQYPLVEFASGVVFLICFLKFGFSVIFIKSIFLLSVLIIVSFIDFEYSVIPGKLIIFLGIVGIILDILGYKSNTSLLNFLYGFILGGGLIFLIVLITGAMGGGDVQLMAAIGIYLGLRLTLLTLLLSFVTGAAAGIVLIILKKKTRRDYIPFGPWISIAAFISVFLGEGMVNWYLSLL
ncbi:MAG: prepilin peptidase [Clostridiales bacterium]|nr:prepilin peptidase [Clostridiales bacterium]